MKLNSHIIGGFGFASLANLLFGSDIWALSYIFILSVVINIAIDIGHERLPSGRVVRSPYTHEVLSCILISMSIGYMLWLLLGSIYGVSLYLSIYASALIAISHLIGDLVTKSGIYINMGGALLRISLSTLSYRDPRLNIAFIVIQIIPLTLSLITMQYSFSEHPSHALIDKLLSMYGITSK
ncbi:MAG: hypothetical protein QXQ57_05275 [Sulfolobales archaeon]